MNREFKFRVFNNHDAIMMYFDFDDLHKQKFADEGFFPWKAIKKEVIMQYTGLTDRDGKEIYEGDIVREIGNKEIFGNVVFSMDELQFGYINKGKGYADVLYDEFNSMYNVKIIGNIYENPKLIKEVKS